MEKKQYQAALQFAQQNLEKINETIPLAIKERESTLFSRLSKSKGNSLTMLKRLYSEMDIIYEFLGTISQCKKGCSYCCHQEIAISELEIEHIKKNTSAKTYKTTNLTILENQACPFLKNNKCSIYEYRPFMCRRHLSIADTPRWCEPDVCTVYDFPLIKLTEVDRSYAHIVSQSSMSDLKDIRRVFKQFHK